MHGFVRNFLTEWRKLNLPFADETFVTAVSGGADSVSLLLALAELRDRKKLNLRFVVAHFNHNLRGAESEKDARLVVSLTNEFGFELALGSGNIERAGNLEQNARRARYEFLTETAQNVQACGILTAHTMNDQAETFLINLLRGSGLQGLSGMSPIRLIEREKGRRGEKEKEEFEFFNLESEIEKSKIQNPKSKIRLVRPLLNWAKRRDTENYCRECEIEYRNDAMNDDLAFRRVRVRKVLLPLLEDFNSKIIETLSATAKIFRRENEFLECELKKIEAENDSRTFDDEQKNLPLEKLKNLPKAMFYRVVRQWLETNRGSLRGLELKHLEAIERLIYSRKSGRSVELPNGETVVKKDGKLSFKD
ncbi:MAG: tRNA lysidine(34) synthetase TilS [Acidobacteriota bacterium]|nr:tRNA lysidine(34) synthetase TilS [Acidobacteriota bacterium]